MAECLGVVNVVPWMFGVAVVLFVVVVVVVNLVLEKVHLRIPEQVGRSPTRRTCTRSADTHRSFVLCLVQVFLQLTSCIEHCG